MEVNIGGEREKNKRSTRTLCGPQEIDSCYGPGKVNPVINVMEPVIAQSIFESIGMLINGMETLTRQCVRGITALNPILGYEACTRLAKEAIETNRGVYELVLEKQLLTREDLDRLLVPEAMLKPSRVRRDVPRGDEG